MNRIDWMKWAGTAGVGIALERDINIERWEMSKKSISGKKTIDFGRADFGNDFKWGVASASFQTEGAWNTDGKGESIWDHFSRKSGKIERGENADTAADFYHRYEEDIELIRSMNFKVFRFSLSWPRILPGGTGKINRAGLDFYHRVIEKCLNAGLEPWITIYHWDLPQALEVQGGWTSRKIVDWFSEFVNLVTLEYGNKVKTWMVMNEQFSFTAGGYLAGFLAPGRHGVNGFLKAVHHSVLCNAEGGRIIRNNIPDAQVGTTFFTAHIEPSDQQEKNRAAAMRIDSGINRLFIEPSLGMGYPVEHLSVLKKIDKFKLDGDDQRMVFDFDFIGIQYYFRAVVEKSILPIVRANEIKAADRGVPMNEMGYEIYPEGLYDVIKKFSQYKGIRSLIVTENGTCVADQIKDDKVRDKQRTRYFKNHLSYVLKAKGEGIPVNGYLAWAPTDNFEWDKGYRTRFGLVYIDFTTQKRTMKSSGKWFRKFLE